MAAKLIQDKSTFANIANGLTPQSDNHILAATEDIYDIVLGRYQSDINADNSLISKYYWSDTGFLHSGVIDNVPGEGVDATDEVIAKINNNESVVIIDSDKMVIPTSIDDIEGSINGYYFTEDSGNIYLITGAFLYPWSEGWWERKRINLTSAAEKAEKITINTDNSISLPENTYLGSKNDRNKVVTQSQIAGIGNAMHFKGVVTSKPPIDSSDFVEGDVIVVKNSADQNDGKEFVLIGEGDSREWIELGDESAYVVKENYNNVTDNANGIKVSLTGSNYNPGIDVAVTEGAINNTNENIVLGKTVWSKFNGLAGALTNELTSANAQTLTGLSINNAGSITATFSDIEISKEQVSGLEWYHEENVSGTTCVTIDAGDGSEDYPESNIFLNAYDSNIKLTREKINLTSSEKITSSNDIIVTIQKPDSTTEQISLGEEILSLKEGQLTWQ